MARGDADLSLYLAAEEAKSQEIKQHYQWIWDECIQWYMNLVRTNLPPGAEWMRGDMIADAMKFVESVLPTWVLRVIGRPDHFRVEAPTATGDEYVDGVYAYLKQSLRRQNFVWRTVPSFRMAFIQGHVESKTVWHREWGEELIPIMGDELRDANGELIQRAEPSYETRDKLTFNGPWTSYPDLHKLWKSPQKDVMGRHIWMQELMTLNLDWMVAMNDRFKKRGQTLYKSLNKLQTTISARPSNSSSGMRQMSIPWGFGVGAQDNRSTTARISGIGEETLHGDNAIPVKQWWGPVPKRVKNYSGQTQNRLILRTDMGDPDSGALILRDVPAPTPDHKHPYRPGPVQQIGDEPYGRSPLMWVGPEIETRSELRNNLLAESYMRIFGIRHVDGSADLDENRMYQFPGATWIWPNPDRRDLRQMVVHEQRPPMDSSAFVVQQDMERHSRETFGVDEQHFGEGLGARTTRFEANLVAQKSGGRAELMTLMMSYGVEKVVLEQSFDLAKTFLTDDEVVALEDEFGTPVIIRGNELQHNIHIVMEPDDTVDTLRSQQIMEMLERLANIPEAAVAIRWTPLAREIVRRSGLEAPMRFVRTENEIDSIMADQQEQQLTQELIAVLAGRNSQSRAVESGQGSPSGRPRVSSEAS